MATAAFLWGASASIGKAAFKGMLAAESITTPLDAVILAQTRTAFSLLILLPFLLARFGKDIFRISRRDLFLSLLMGGLGIAGANFFYYYAIDKTSVATAITIQYTAPIWVLLYMVARKVEHATAQRVGSVVLAFLGVVLVLGVLRFDSHSPFVSFVGFRWDTVGLLAACGAAVSFAFYNLIGSYLVRRNNNWNVFAYALLGSVVLWLVLNPPWKVVVAHYTGGQWLFLALFAVFSMLLPFSCYMAGLKYLDATRAIVTVSLEPVFAILLAAFVVREKPDPAQITGMLLVLAATVVVQLPERQS
jgi:drug/metabolite transporter, DME family